MEKVRFSFEDLEVWQKAVEFAKIVIEIAEEINTDRKHFRLIEQLEAASTSIALNIAEGKGRYSKKEFIQFLYIARGSLYETITLLIIFHKKNWINDIQLGKMKNFGDEIGKMLSSLINSVRNSMN
jgi:four helix bundle protein